MKKNGRDFLVFSILLSVVFPLISDPSPISSPPDINNPFLPPLSSPSPSPSSSPFLEWDYYRDSCPGAERIIRSMVQSLLINRPEIGPALLRLLFHDCFVQGCDASVLLDSVNGVHSEKDAPPNLSLKGFDVLDLIKSKMESMCPGIVSCADILVLAARESVFLGGGPFYQLQTGRRDSSQAFFNLTVDLPSPTADLSVILSIFSSKSFNERETVSLLGSHSIGVIHCSFFKDRLFNFSGSGQADPSLESNFQNLMRLRCNDSSLSEGSMSLERDGANEVGFGTHYYQGLLQGKSILHSDQQFMTAETTASWVRLYASNNFLFRRDFSRVMTKLSNLGVLTGSDGEIRTNCRSANS